MARIFAHGGLRLVLLSVLEEGPKHGYELIVALEDRFMGMYRPSSGTIYPRLAALEEEGLIVSEEVDAKKVYRLTDAGHEELRLRRAEVEDTFVSATSTVREVMGTLQTDIRRALTAVQDEVRHSGEFSRADAGEAVRRAARVATEEARRVRRMAEDLRDHATHEGRAATDDVRAAARESGGRARRELDDLAAEVAAWAAEASDHVRRYLPDEGQRARLRAALDEVRQTFSDTFESRSR